MTDTAAVSTLEARNDVVGYQGADDSATVRDCHRRAAGAISLAPAATVGDGRTVDVLICRWDDPHTVSDDGRVSYTELFARGGLVPAGRVLVRNEHSPLDGVAHRAGADPAHPGVVVGQLSDTFVRADGLYGRIRVVDNDDGRRLLGLIDPDEPIIDSLSIEFDDVYRPIRAGDTIVRSAARLTGLVFTVNPQRGDARILSVRSQPKEPTMSDTPDTPIDPDDDPTPADEPEVRGVTRSAVVPAQRSAPRPGVVAAGIDVESAQALQFLQQYRSFGEFCHAAATENRDGAQRHARALALGVGTGGAIRSHRRALEEAALADIAGLLPPQWLSTVIDLYRSQTPTLNAWSTAPLPVSGNVFTQPIVGDRPIAATVAESADLTAGVTSNKVTVTTAVWNLIKIASGQSMSVEVIARSDPDYLTMVMGLFTRELGRAWNAAVATGLLAAADDVNTTGLEYVTAKAFPDVVIDASKLFLTTLGRPAEVIAMSPFLWAELGKAKDTTDRYMFPQIGQMNVVGSFDATSPAGQIQTIDYYVEPSWSTTVVQGVIGVREAYRSMTGPIETMSAASPLDLTYGTAVYQFGAHGKVDATGLQLIVNAA